MPRLISLLWVLLLAAGSALAEWKEPESKVVSETQYQLWADTTKDWNAVSAKLNAAQQAATTDAQRQALAAQFDAIYQQVYDRQHTSKPEIDWIARQLARASLQTQITGADAALAKAQQQLVQYQQAKNAGLRVLSDADRAATIKAFTDDQRAALDEVQQHQGEVKAAQDEARQHEADAAAADNLAKNPPADVAADNRPAYIEGQKQLAQAARDQANQSRARAADAQKAQDAAQARADAAAKRVAHPETPVIDDEKSAVAADNDAGIAQAQADIAQARDAKDQLVKQQLQLAAPSKDPSQDIPPENLELLQKHAEEFTKLYQGLNPLPATRPN